MKPIKLSPVFKDYLWGGEKLRTEFGKDTDMKPLAESWELSCHPNGLTTLNENQEITLEDYINSSDENLLGTNSEKFENFPVLLKLIDAKDRLSLQVHPDDEYAHKNENQYGKTEAWYVLSADEGAQIIYGLKKDLSKKEIKKYIKDNTILDYVNTVEAKEGDLFFIEPGCLHAIGKGIMIAEIQQSSDVTYRVYDYDRRDADGNPRDLHVEKACEVIKYREKPTNYRKQSIEMDGFAQTNLADCKYFKFKKYDVDVEMTADITKESFAALLCIDGTCEIMSDGETMTVNKGETLFCPAGDYSFDVAGKCTLLEVRI